MRTEIIVSFLATAILVTGAPLSQEYPGSELYLQPQIRQKRSQYGNQYGGQYGSQYGQAPYAGAQYLSPCAAASSHLAPAYQLNLLGPAHGAGYGLPHPYGSGGYGPPGYRASDFSDEQEMMNFSDMDTMPSEHLPQLRYGYDSPAAPVVAPAPAHILAGHGAALGGYAPAIGPAVGYFHNARTSGCNVPLLFSCSPSIVPGRLVSAHPHYGYAGAGGAYREMDEPSQPEAHQEHREDATHKLQSSPATDTTHAATS